MTTKTKWTNIENTLDNLGVKYDIMEDKAMIEFWTDTSGQDILTEFDFDGTPEDFVTKFKERAEAYNVDNEVVTYINMRGTRGIPNTVRELLDDCQEAKNTLSFIAENLSDTIRPKKQKWFETKKINPDKDGFYLVTCDGEICGEEKPFTTIGEFANGKWIDDTEEYQCIIAWMPMPEPYKTKGGK